MAETQYFGAPGAIYTITGAPVAGTDEVQTITASPAAGSVTAGTFRLSFQGFTTAAISWSASTSILETALNNLPSIANGGTGLVGVVVTGGALPTTAMTVTFSGSNVRKKVLPNLVLANNSLTGGGTFLIAEGTAGIDPSFPSAPKGALLLRTDSTALVYVNTGAVGTPPTWTVVGSQT